MKKHFSYLIGSLVFIAALAGARLADAGPFSAVKDLGETLTDTKEGWDKGSKKVKYKISKKRGKIYYKTSTSNPVTGEWGTQMTCENPSSSTCRDGKDHFANCMNQTKNYYYRLLAAHLETRLANMQNLSDSRRKELEDDIASIKGAVETGIVIDPDPKDPQRWLGWLSREDRTELNRLNSKYVREVSDDCQARFGTMGQFK